MTDDQKPQKAGPDTPAPQEPRLSLPDPLSGAAPESGRAQEPGQEPGLAPDAGLPLQSRLSLELEDDFSASAPAPPSGPVSGPVSGPASAGLEEGLYIETPLEAPGETAGTTREGIEAETPQSPYGSAPDGNMPGDIPEEMPFFYVAEETAPRAGNGGAENGRSVPAPGAGDGDGDDDGGAPSALVLFFRRHRLLPFLLIILAGAMIFFVTSKGREEELLNYAEIARQGYAEGRHDAEFDLGKMYLEGSWGVEKDPQKGLAMILSAANSGFKEARFWMGNAYLEGKYVPMNGQKAVEWYERIAAGNDFSALMKLAHIYREDTAVPKDIPKAIEYAKRAAALNTSPAYAMNLVGYLYASLDPPDAKNALAYYRKSAEGGNSTAMHNIAGYYLYGDGVPVNFGEAFAWYRKAAAAGRKPLDSEIQEARATCSPANSAPNIYALRECVFLAAYTDDQFAANTLRWSCYGKPRTGTTTAIEGGTLDYSRSPVPVRVVVTARRAGYVQKLSPRGYPYGPRQPFANISSIRGSAHEDEFLLIDDSIAIAGGPGSDDYVFPRVPSACLYVSIFEMTDPAAENRVIVPRKYREIYQWYRLPRETIVDVNPGSFGKGPMIVLNVPEDMIKYATTRDFEERAKWEAERADYLAKHPAFDPATDKGK